MTTFSRFPPRLQEAILTRLHFTSLRPVQEFAGDALLSGKNAVVLAPTAGGKTEAAIFPVLAGLIDQPVTSVGALYIAPIKALLNNQLGRLGLYTDMVGMRCFAWHGDTKVAAKNRFLKAPTELLMTTPESLEVLLLSPRVDHARLFAQLRCVIIDEVHALAGQERGAHLMSVLERLTNLAGRDVQRVGLSATVGNPEDILRWLQGSSKREGVVVSPPPVPRTNHLTISLPGSVAAIATAGAERARGKKSLFYCQARATAEAVAAQLRGQGTEVLVHHSSISVDERQRAEERFQHGTNASIVCTSTLELGIDVGDLDLVLQAGAPSTVASFKQRLGRTGRRDGQTPTMAFLCEDTEAVLLAAALVERANARWVEPVPVQTRCWTVLVQQLLALTLQHGAIGPREAWALLSRVPDFSGITKPELDALLKHLAEKQYLFFVDGKYAVGDATFARFGRKHFSELYAVFTSPLMFRVLHRGAELGSIEPSFVERLEPGDSAFLLAGRAWVVRAVDHAERLVRVAPAPKGMKPTWGGFMPRLLGFEVCQQIRALLAGHEGLPYFDDPAARAVEDLRGELGDLLRAKGPAVRVEDDGSATWWTFAGGRINHTLKYALELSQGWKVSAENFFVRITGDGVSHASVTKALRKLDASWWSEKRKRELAARVPLYRLSKFQELLPGAALTEVLGSVFIDVEGARRVVAGAS